MISDTVAEAVITHVLVEEYLTLADDSTVALLPHVLRVAAELGLADLLWEGPAHVDQLATAAGANRDALYRLLRAMASIALVEETTPHRFRLLDSGRRLRANAPNGVRESVLQLDSQLAWVNASDCVRTGRPVRQYPLRHSTGRDFFGHKDRDANANQSFMRRMRERAARCYQAAVSEVDWSPSDVVMDIGGNDGYLLAAVLRREPALAGVLFDRPSVIAAVKQAGSLREFGSRCWLESGDFFEKVPAGADTHLMCSVLHDWADEPACEILSRSREAATPPGRLIVVEMLVPPGNGWHPSKWSDLGMMVLTGGRERTEPELTRLLEAGGYTVTRVRGIPQSYFSVIEAMPA